MTKYYNKYICPCCRLPTLYSRGDYNICPICFWEDDGQDDHNADMIMGGPNKDYSLKEARANYESNQTMYRISDTYGYAIGQKAIKKYKLYKAAILKAVESGNPTDWSIAEDIINKINSDEDIDV